MRACRYNLLIPAVLTALLAAGSAPNALAEDVDLSCMSYSVLPKTQVSERYKEYDVVVLNECPGPVYWAMCIERLDPYSNRILEAHTPTGYTEAGQKVRVNLQMKKGPDAMDFQQRFQEFYASVDFSIDPSARAGCIARNCEAARRDLRRQIGANLQSWESAAVALDRKLAADCPESGWGKTEQVEQCEAAVRAEAQPRLDELAGKDAELREQLELTGPPGCRLYAGDLVPE
jgi:hypothetical protein